MAYTTTRTDHGPQVADVVLEDVFSEVDVVMAGVPEHHAGQEHAQQRRQVNQAGQFAARPRAQHQHHDGGQIRVAVHVEEHPKRKPRHHRAHDRRQNVQKRVKIAYPWSRPDAEMREPSFYSLVVVRKALPCHANLASQQARRSARELPTQKIFSANPLIVRIKM